KVARGQTSQLDGAFAAGPEADFPARPVLQVHFAVSRLKTVAQGGLAAALAFEITQREFDVLAGTQGIGGKIGTGAKVVPRLLTANGDAVAVLVLRIGNFEFGEDEVVADVHDVETLIAAELASQLDLPVFQRHA